MSGITIGTCSLCGGPVVSEFYQSVVPIPPRCAKCGAESAMHGPIIPMNPSTVRIFISSDGTSACLPNAKDQPAFLAVTCKFCSSENACQVERKTDGVICFCSNCDREWTQPNDKDNRAGPENPGKAGLTVVAGSGASPCWAASGSWGDGCCFGGII